MIPNLVKGKGITGAIAYAMGQGNEADGKTRKKLAPGQTPRAEILGGQNFGFEIDSAATLDLARRLMEWNGKAENQASRGRKCANDCLNLSASWEPGQNPTRDEMLDAGKALLKALGMEGAQAVFIAHDDTDHKHIHIIASRIDPVTGKTYSQADDFTTAQAWGLQYERQHGQIPENEARRNLHKIVDAIEARDGAALVENLTARTPTFTPRDLDKALHYGVLTKDEREKFRSEILADKNVIGLKDTPDAKVTRYTTRDVLASEMALLRTAQKLADDRGHGLSETRVDQTAAAFTLKPEQAQALAHLTSAEAFGVLWGEAGTGKSHTLKAVRTAYEEEGAHVIGLAKTHKVVGSMREGGFKANTLDSELKGIEAGRASWNKKTVVILDEAAMVSTEQLAQLAGAAQKAGAKFIIAGDDAQLPSIERGGMFETLRQKHGAAILTEVQRVKDIEERKLWGKMHKGDFREMLAKQDKAGNLHWSERQTDALREMAQKYMADAAADPGKKRFMFAFSNAEVGALNDYARDGHKRRGDLGEDCALKTAHGEATFATGDRIQFTGNGYGKKAIHAGLSNGQVGTIKEIAFEGDFLTPRVTVTLDTAKGEKAKEVSFVVGSDGKAGEFDQFKLGYAGTIYRGQGDTLDVPYACHSSQWRGSAAYVALTRHREEVHIFASYETVRGMESKAARAGFERVAEQATLDPDALAAAQKNHDLDVMARGLARAENKRAATAYHLDDTSALRIDFDDVAQAATAAPSPAPASLRGHDRVQAFLDAERRQREAQATGQADRSEPTHEPQQPAEVRSSMTVRNADRVEEFLKAENLDRETRKALLQELGRAAGREVNEQEGKEIIQDRGGGQSL
jgi:hypothetical protein